MMALEPMEAELWIRYIHDRDSHARDSLFVLYGPWASSIAKSVHRRVWAYSVDCDDFVQNAKVGLLEAISRYDPERGIPFQAFAKPRVRGAVFNGLKAILGDRPTSRDEARFKARLRSLQEATDGEVDAFEGVVNSILDLGLGFLLDEAAHVHEATVNSDSYVYARTSEIEARLLTAVDKLPDRLRLITQAHYYQGLKFQELASTLGVTKGRVSQLHKSALERLRGLLQDLA